jgi:hypothetical protein
MFHPQIFIHSHPTFKGLSFGRKETFSMSVNEIYSRFIDWLDKGWWHLPASEHLLPSIKAFFTPEEAALLTGLPFKPTELKELCKLKGFQPDDLRVKLDALAQKGVVWRTNRDGDFLYN